ADNHTKGLLSDHHGLTSSLIGGYHLAFLTGAAVIATGIALAFVLLRQHEPRPELQIADSRNANVPAHFDTTRHAARPTSHPPPHTPGACSVAVLSWCNWRRAPPPRRVLLARLIRRPAGSPARRAEARGSWWQGRERAASGARRGGERHRDESLALG